MSSTDRNAVPVRPALHHVTFKTTRLQEMIDWYGTVVGAEANFRDDTAAWLSNDRANHRIAFLALPGLGDDPEKRRHTGMHHSAFEFETFADLMANYARLRDLGIVPSFSLDHGLTTSLYYSDPDGNVVELQVDNFDDWEASTAWMQTAPEFKRNPIGVFFDPEKVHAAHARGAAFKDLEPRIYAGEFPPERTPDLGIG